MYNILVCDDDKEIVKAIEIYLLGEKYNVLKAYNGQEAMDILEREDIHLLLIDVMMPVLDGIRATLEIRKKSGVPIIILSAKSEDNDKILGLNIGADDYITKPFGSEELLARIRTALRHSAQVASSGPRETVYSRDGLVIDFDKRVVTLNGEDIHLTQIEYKLVSLLAKNAGKVLTYDFILKEIWGPYADTDNQILRVNMANIRRKLESNPAEPHYIFTEIGVGYRMKE